MRIKTGTLLFLVLSLLLLAACSSETDTETQEADTGVTPMNQTLDTAVQSEAPTAEPAISQSDFGMANGEDVYLYSLRNESGMEATITNYGGIVVSLTAPDRNGKFEDIVLGYETLAEYEKENPYFGALIGRYGNRIDEGQFQLDGNIYQLTTNDGPNHLHGGLRGFDKVVWDATMEETENGPSLLLSYTSEDGEEGYPGTLQADVRYTLTHDNELAIEYRATTDKPTPVNLTHHSYFNLSGNVKRDILGHELQIHADHFTPVGETLIPTGEYRPVEGTPFDFRTPKPIGRDIGMDNEQLEFGLGYDHNWVIDRDADGEWRHVATLTDPQSGRSMTIHTSEPGLQFYSGNFLDGSLSGKGAVYEHRTGLCLETQHFPDSPNQPDFPSTILRPGEVYETKTVYSFGTDG